MPLSRWISSIVRNGSRPGACRAATDHSVSSGCTTTTVGSAEPTVVVVQPDDTLWSVAARHAPGRDPFRTIEEIQRLNGIADHTIHPGQQLLVPAR